MEKPIDKPKCEHVKTYVAVRHTSGISLVKCSECGTQI
jgi:transcription elongation factor Elf1